MTYTSLTKAPIWVGRVSDAAGSVWVRHPDFDDQWACLDSDGELLGWWLPENVQETDSFGPFRVEGEG